MSGHYHYNCEEYCDDCLPVATDHPDVDLDSGDQDSPAHCCKCHRPLDYTLTNDGVNYVIENLLKEIDSEDRDTVYPCYEGTYYTGSRHCEITRDWAKHLKDHYLSQKDREIVETFLTLTETPKS